MSAAPSPLISVAELAAELEHANLRVVDCRFELGVADSGERAFEQSRIPGARYAHLERDLSDMSACAEHGRHPLPTPLQLGRAFARLDIGADTRVIAYDHDHGAYAARLWWLLRESGHAQVQVLNGGFAAWINAGLAVERGPVRQPIVKTVTQLELRAAAWLDTAALRVGLSDGSISLIDARGAARFRGEIEPIDAVAGHVPGAMSRPFLDNLAADGSFKLPATLHREFSGLLVGRTPASVVHMCGSGVTACHNQLAMVHAGLLGSRLYPDSWSGWITDRDRPVAVGPD